MKGVGEMRKVIIDCDPGIDDSLALLYALKSPEIDVVAICVVAGNVPVEIGVKNVYYCLDLVNRRDIPVYLGASEPLVVPFVSAQDTHGFDGLGESHLAQATIVTPQEQKAAEFYAQTFAHPQEISVIALGPLTNIAQALDLNVNLGLNMQRFVSMGGTYLSHGNCSPVAEYNYWCDPDAAKIVYEKLGCPIEMIGLDVTRKIVLTPNLLQYSQYLNPQMGEILAKITQFYFDFHWQQEHVLGCVINDPLAVAYFIHTQLCSGFNSYVVIENQGVSRGQSLVDAHDFWRKPANAKILTQVDLTAFFVEFLAIVLDVPHEVIAQDMKNLKLGE